MAPGYVEKVAASCPDDRVHFTGYVPEAAIAELYRAASLLVLPYSSATGASGVAHLACEYGLPLVSADIPDFRGLIARNKEFLADRKQCYAVQISVGPTNPYELARAVFGDLDVINQFLALSETVAYLDLLERDGEIEVDWGDKIIEVRSQA